MDILHVHMLCAGNAILRHTTRNDQQLLTENSTNALSQKDTIRSLPLSMFSSACVCIFVVFFNLVLSFSQCLN